MSFRKYFLVPAIMFTLLVFGTGFNTGSSNQEIIQNGDVYYFANTIVMKVKTNNGESVLLADLPVLLNEANSSFRFTNAEFLFPRKNTDRDFGLDNIVIVNYESESDPNFVASKIRGLKEVEWAEPRFLYSLLFDPNDPSYASQWNLHKIQAANAWDINQGDTSIVIAIIDTGVDWDHPDLAANIWINHGEIPDNGIDDGGNGYIDDVRGWDFGGLTGIPDNDPMEDRPDHGTHVAGIASAVTNNGIGIAAIGFKCKIMAVKTSQDNIRNPQGQALIAYGYEGIVYATDNGAHVINCSWGGGNFSILAQEVINYATANGSLVVAAAGNSGNSSSFYPAGYDNVLSVASTTTNDTKSGFSTFGPSVDISAPGSNIYSTWQDNVYATLSGTSMASPLAAGTAALVFAQFPNYSPLQVGEQVRVTSDNIDHLNPNFQNLIGKGRINAHNALITTNAISVRGIEFVFSDDPPGGNGDGIFQAGETISLGIRVKNYLNPVNNLTITLQSKNNYSTIQNGMFNVSSLGMLQTADNFSNKFTFTLSTMPANARLPFILNFSAGSYTDYQWTETLGNPTYATQSGNDVSLTITSKGTLAYNDFPNNIQGDGFRYQEGPNLLFEGAIILATSAAQVSDAARGANQSFQNTDFTVIQPFILNVPGQHADYQGTGVFSDDAAGSNKIGITSTLNSYSYVNAPHNNYIILRYSLKNTTSSVISNLHAGLFFDWDIIDGSGEGDITQWDETGKLGYVRNTTSGPPTLVASALISSEDHGFWAIKNDGGDGGFSIYDGFTDAEKWQALSNGIGKPNAGPGDVSHVISGGPFTIAPGDTIDVAFVVAAGSNLEELRTSIANARIRFEGILTFTHEEEPGVPLTFGLSQNYPNPFNPGTVISWQSPVGSLQSLKVYDVLGREVAALVNEYKQAGTHSVEFNATGLPSGVYFYRLNAGSFSETKKMILLR